ncbi:serine--tRNA ligase [Demequina sp. TTPB684]|uniref:serine--tRNA ligase n=1 Tax=unclassified Demequina TaxID=2620311 RepID=UPI001CF133CB|nr:MULTISPECIES: serine--tRNA ligase [unclassified Demequina]MCB2413692.1 serine--tRNA ligase [Demequina sp. TTPB684]UPU87754.1 serine--tRNA ligase [Demequina sp. TMPB413]
MIDLALLRSDPDRIRESQRMRGESPAVVDEVLAADECRRTALTQFEQARAEQKSLGREVAGASGDEKTALLVRTKELAQRVKALQADADAADAQARELLMSIGNVPEPGVPAGGADDFAVLRTEGTPRDFAAEGVPVRDHLALGEGLKAIDMERGAKVSGARFYFLTGVGAQLELAILNAAMGIATAQGFVPMITPTLVRPETMRGTGFLGAHADEIYFLEKDELYLTGTSEVALAGYHADEILDLNDGPLRYAGWSACYRREAGSAGRDTRGIIRVHQFHKVEMFSYARPEDAVAEHENFLAIQESMLQALELPYRLIDTAAGDLGSSAARKYDCEAWLPSQERWMEVTSTSNCTTFQARRLGIRERGADGTSAVATINGTIGTTRWIVALLENHQQADGSVYVPPILRPYLGGVDLLTPPART